MTPCPPPHPSGYAPEIGVKRTLNWGHKWVKNAKLLVCYGEFLKAERSTKLTQLRPMASYRNQPIDFL